jgi:hypothetical protein
VIILGRPDAAITRRIAESEPRLIVVAMVVGPSTLGASLLSETGADAVLQIQRPPNFVIRGLLADRPLDVIAGVRSRRSHSILNCVADGETCVSLSRVVGGALLLDDRADVHGAVDTRDALAAEWARVLTDPLAAADRSAAEIEISDRDPGATLDDLGRAVRFARQARALSAEQPVIANALARIQEVGFERASTRHTLVDICTFDDKPVPRDSALAVDDRYRLRTQIARHRTASRVSELLPVRELSATFAQLKTVEITVVVYADSNRIALDSNRTTLQLTPFGDTLPAWLVFRVHRAGPFALRVCLFHGKALLQSVLIEGTASSDRRASRPLTMRLDYATSSHLMLLDHHEQPDLTIWANEISADGTHWIGAYAGDDSTPARASAERFTTDDLQAVACGLEEALTAVQLVSKEPLRYRFDADIALDGPQQLTRLARAGWKAYTALFDRLQEESPAAATHEGLIAIALCRPERTNIAWAAIYDYHLDGDDHELCKVFRNERVLERAAACRVRVDCPLRDPQRASRTVCPFGFWGIRHRIEQPLSHIGRDETLSDEAPYDELQRAARLRQTIGGVGDGLSLVIASSPRLKRYAQSHFDEIAALSSRVRSESDRDVVLRLLADPGNHIYYFFCHGVGERMDFRLQIQGDIGVADLNHKRYMWNAPAPAPLVFLNGCDTTAFRTDRINKMLERLRAMGASGVIGTEIAVHTSLAAEVGRRLLRALVAGKRIGDAFRDMRRALLCEQLNPLGLAYTPFASARLHLCSASPCAACAGTPVAAT